MKPVCESNDCPLPLITEPNLPGRVTSPCPDQPGCYALVTYHGDVLYVGLATSSIRSRMGNHLNTEVKRKGTDLGVPFWFYYLVRSAVEVAPIERGWMNQATLEDGEMPPLNKVYSPV